MTDTLRYRYLPEPTARDPLARNMFLPTGESLDSLDVFVFYGLVEEVGFCGSIANCERYQLS